jgi:hypothetical protein
MVYLSDSYIQALPGNTIAMLKNCIESKVKSGDISPHFYLADTLKNAPAIERKTLDANTRLARQWRCKHGRII